MSSINTVSFSSARTTTRFPSRCASAIQIVRHAESRAETQPQLQPALLRLSAMVSQLFTVPLLTIQHRLRYGLAPLQLCAHFLDLRCLLFHGCSERLNFLLPGTADCLDAGKNLASLRGYSPQAQIVHPAGFVYVARLPSAPFPPGTFF